MDDGARTLQGARAIDVRRSGSRVEAVVFKGPAGTFEVTCQRLVIADGARSQLGRKLGREWHKSTAYGVAARAYVKSGRADDEWISSHLELRGTDNQLLSGYGWIFPLGDGEVNIGVGTLATDKHPADVNLRQLISPTTRKDSARTGSCTATCGTRGRRYFPWAERCPAWPGRTGCSWVTPPVVSTRSTARASTTAWRPAAWR